MVPLRPRKRSETHAAHRFLNSSVTFRFQMRFTNPRRPPLDYENNWIMLHSTWAVLGHAKWLLRSASGERQRCDPLLRCRAELERGALKSFRSLFLGPRGA